MKRYCLWLILTSQIIFNFSFAQSMFVGKGDMRWFGLNLYEIALFTPTGLYETGKPLTLVINYHIKIDRDKLISISEKEVTKMGELWRNEWTEQLQAIWPTVEHDDELKLVVNDQGESEFYYNEQFRGTLTDPEFGERFTAIWLSPETSAAKLRKKLIGAKNDS